MAANVKEFLAEAETPKQTFRQTNLLIHTHRFTLVPLEWFEDELMETFFYQNFPKANNEIVLCNVLGKSNIVVIFSIDKLTHLYLSECFPDARFLASVSPQIEYLFHRSKQGNNRKLYANLHPRSMEIFAMDRGQTLLCNSYDINSPEDYEYYMLNVWQQLAYDQRQDELHLAGEATGKKEIADRLKTYILKVFIINPKAEFATNPTNEKANIPFDIQSLLICE